MIERDRLVEIGNFLKPHGIKGELSYMPQWDIDLMELHCLMVETDGLLVPFFPTGVRKKGHEQLLVTIDGITDEKEAMMLANRPVFALRDDVDIEEDDEEGYGADQFIGFTVIDETAGEIGIIEYIDDSTDNWLFMVKPSIPDEKGNLIAIPIADELISSIDLEGKRLEMNLPEGLLDL